MTQEKKTETEKKIGNWTCQLIGSVLLGAQAYKYITDSWGEQVEGHCRQFRNPSNNAIIEK